MGIYTKLRPCEQNMYHGYRCYTKDDKPLGWLYTVGNNTEYSWTNKDLHWCKRWKKQQTAQKHFNHYNRTWQLKSYGGYLKIEIMPEVNEPEPPQLRRQKLLEEWGEPENEQPQQLNSNQSPVFLLQELRFELIEGLPDNHGVYLFLLEDGSIKEGYYSSFPFPHHKDDVRVADCENEEFYYQKAVGWLKQVK